MKHPAQEQNLRFVNENGRQRNVQTKETSLQILSANKHKIKNPCFNVKRSF